MSCSIPNEENKSPSLVNTRELVLSSVDLLYLPPLDKALKGFEEAREGRYASLEVQVLLDLGQRTDPVIRQEVNDGFLKKAHFRTPYSQAGLEEQSLGETSANKGNQVVVGGGESGDGLLRRLHVSFIVTS